MTTESQVENTVAEGRIYTEDDLIHDNIVSGFNDFSKHVVRFIHENKRRVNELAEARATMLVNFGPHKKHHIVDKSDTMTQMLLKFFNKIQEADPGIFARLKK